MDTIAAVSTGNTLSAVGILRVSGDRCFAVCEAAFRAVNGTPFRDLPPRMMTLGSLLDAQGRPIDQILAVRFPGPHSYTGEDCAEFHCHGSPVILAEALRALFAAGARQAGRGEFTKRAFLHGNLDLTEAEAVIDLIEAETAAAARNAAGHLGGSLRRRLEGVRDRLLTVASQFCAVVDYPDEEIEDLPRDRIRDALSEAEDALRTLRASFRRGRVLRQGVPTVLLGRPNVGKSSLLNALAGYERAIVTDIPGTTRDTVEEKIAAGGVLLRLVDTAGIRESGDAVERLGVERARQAAAEASLALLVLDGSMPLTAEDRLAMEAAERAERTLTVLNKSDLPRRLDASGLGECIEVSAKEGRGLDELERRIASLFPAGEAGELLTNARQAEAAERAADALRRAREALEDGMTPDAVLSDVEAALNALGELTGRTLREDLVDRIFERFCVGK